MWQFEFEAPVGTRVLKRGFGVVNSSDLWWDGKTWSKNPTGYCSNICSLRSFKAFKRHLRKHTEALKDVEVIFLSKFVGYNITARYVQC